MVLAPDLAVHEVRRIKYPVTLRELPADLLTPVSAFLKIRVQGAAPFLMESASGGERFSRFSILGMNPSGEIKAAAPGAATWTRDGRALRGSLLDMLRSYVADRSEAVPGLPFCGGLVGSVGFDFIHEIEALPREQMSPEPMAWLGDYRTFIVFDHLKQVVQLVSRSEPGEAERELTELQQILEDECPARSQAHFEVGSRTSNFSRGEFCSAVERLKHHIQIGDIFQAVLSQQFSRHFEGDPFQLYRALRRVNPSPYMFYHETPVGTLIGASPELLVGVEGRTARLLPIAGTRPRGVSETEDRAHERALLADPKERAEHMMLVDLARNDLGRASENGSVKVDELAAIHRFSHVMHMVSRVSGRLRDHTTAIDALAASFPAGTVSGAPKVRALELILEHEPTPRGMYSGASGFLGCDGSAEFCITIRTAVAHKGRLTYQAGAGIVADSVPEREYEETIHKAGAIERAIALAGGES
jgi:anthranilate synthase component 1